MNRMKLINYLFDYVILNSKLFNIDESHSLTHSMDVFQMTNKIFESEKIRNPSLIEQEKIIYTSAILHDMCDKKYMNEEMGLARIKDYLEKSAMLTQLEIDISLKIISTMSYSKVKKCGYPDLCEYQLAYHIVRESDLLAAYDFNRCVIFGMMQTKQSYKDAIKIASDLFYNRVLRHNEDGLFITDYSKKLSLKLHDEAIVKMFDVNKFINDK